jgi:hypothetical protein
MSTASERTIQVLEQVVKGVPVGTNLALMHLMWAMISGSFLSSRGAIFGALDQCGFRMEEIRRSWQAMRNGTWSMDRLVKNWNERVQNEGRWQANCYEGYRPMPVGNLCLPHSSAVSRN